MQGKNQGKSDGGALIKEELGCLLEASWAASHPRPALPHDALP